MMVIDNIYDVMKLEVIIYGLQAILYFGCERFQKNFHDVARPIDDRIPLIPWTAFIYVLWFPMIGLFPLAAYIWSGGTFAWEYMLAIVICNAISIPAYMIYPTAFERPVCPDKFGGKFLVFIRGCSYRGANCSPSMHCSQCYIIMAMALLCQGMPEYIKLILVVTSCAIVIATQTTKQHVVIDALWALPVAAIAVACGLCL